MQDFNGGRSNVGQQLGAGEKEISDFYLAKQSISFQFIKSEKIKKCWKNPFNKGMCIHVISILDLLARFRVKCLALERRKCF